MSGARILAVDDEPQIRRALRRALEGHGYEVRTVGSGDEALRTLSWRPDAILLDLMLPDLDGLDVARRIREQSTVPWRVYSNSCCSTLPGIARRSGWRSRTWKFGTSSTATVQMPARARRSAFA